MRNSFFLVYGNWKKWQIFSCGTISCSFLEMAYSSVRVQFEIGHEASVRNKRTPEGFTHDWEVFVRGADNTEIQYFVEKVVFYLHETFQRPRRVVKEPPYSVKECGYAGFVLPIDVYLKNLEEPKKITFQYDLQLQSSGPPMSRVRREPRVFQNPSEDFRRKLIRGGGVGVDNPTDDGKASIRKIEEPKHSIPKKHKPELPLSNSFADLFGTPIRRVTPEPKKVTEVVKKIEKKKTSKPVKIEKEPNRDKDKDKTKERDKSKEKSKRPPSPLPVAKIKEEVKIKEEKKFDDREKRKEEPKVPKEEKERKEKHKEKDTEKSHRKEKRPKEVEVVKKSVVSDKPQVDSDETRERPEKEKHKHRHKKKEKEKSRDKEKHKRKDKDGKDRIVDKVKVKEKHRSLSPPSPSPPPPPPQPPAPVRHEKPRRGPLGALIKELSDSGSPASEDDDPPEAKFPVEKTKDSKSKIKESKKEKSPKRKSKNDHDSESKRQKRERERSVSSDRERELELAKRQREEQERRAREEEERLAREREREREEEERRARQREEDERKAKEKEEEEKRARQKERELAEAAKAKAKKEKESRKRNREKVVIEEENNLSAEPAPLQLTDDYLSQLRELQHRIMTIEDNTELQKIVKVIADSGQYELTKKTFDFDLVTLDHATVRRLQEFLSTPS